MKGKATAEQIAAWKAQYGEITEVEVNGSFGYFRNPDRQILRRIMMVAAKDGVKKVEATAEYCWLGGDEDIKLKDEYLFAIMPALESLQITSYEAVIKKL